MTRSYKTVKEKAETLTLVQRSRFIGRCFPVKDEGEALSFLAEIRKQNWDASHHCYAYRIGDTGSIARFSDDGEPGGTAGRPIMDVLTGKELVNTLIVVTRYFGGILLGAGGLVRAYSRSAADACRMSGIVEMCAGKLLELGIDYPRYAAMEALLRERAQILDTNFGAEVTIKAIVEEGEAQTLLEAITDRSGGRCEARLCGDGLIEKPV